VRKPTTVAVTAGATNSGPLWPAPARSTYIDCAPAARLRMWQRLRAPIVSLLVKPIALAAFNAGFADRAI